MEIWLNKSLPQIHLNQLEDPADDVFIGNVISGRGNHRVFNGIWDANDFWMQEILDALYALPRSEALAEILRTVDALLTIGEAIAERCELPRWHSVPSVPAEDMRLPQQRLLRILPSRVTFDRDQLDDLRVNSYYLSPFLFPSTLPPDFADALIGDSGLERQPLIYEDGKVAVVLPSALGHALKHYLVRALKRVDLLPIFKAALAHHQREKALNAPMTSMGAVRVTDGLESSPFPNAVYSFDDGRHAHCVLLPGQDVEEEYGASGRSGRPSTALLALADALLPLISNTAAQYSEQPGYSGGLTVLVFGGIGGVRAIAVPNMPEKWHVLCFSLPDFSQLSMDRFRFVSLWKMCNHRASMKAKNIELICLGGDIHFLSYWKRTKGLLLPNDCDLRGPGQILVSIGEMLGLRC